MMVLYDLVGADPDCRFSPYCWRIKAALALKGLDYDTVPVSFTGKALIGFSGQDKVPVLTDGDRIIADSAAIADFLEDAYPDPPLFGSADTRALTRFVTQWTERVLHTRIVPLIILAIHARLAPEDQAYFRTSREERLRTSLESFAADPEAHRTALAQALAPLRATLAAQPYLAGAAPGYADCVVFGAFQWARAVGERELVAPDDAVAAWRDRMGDRVGSA